MLNKQTIKFLFIIICLIQTFYIFHFRSGFKYEILKSPFSLSSGEHYAVSPEVLEARDIIKKNKLSNFNLSDSLKGDIYFYQTWKFRSEKIFVDIKFISCRQMPIFY